MEENRKHIDDLYREELAGYAEQPDAAVWQSLSGRLDAHFTKAPVPVPYFGWLWKTAALLIAGALLYYVVKTMADKNATRKTGQVIEETINGGNDNDTPGINSAVYPVADEDAQQPAVETNTTASTTTTTTTNTTTTNNTTDNTTATNNSTNTQTNTAATTTAAKSSLTASNSNKPTASYNNAAANTATVANAPANTASAKTSLTASNNNKPAASYNNTAANQATAATAKNSLTGSNNKPTASYNNTAANTATAANAPANTTTAKNSLTGSNINKPAASYNNAAAKQATAGSDSNPVQKTTGDAFISQDATTTSSNNVAANTKPAATNNPNTNKANIAKASAPASPTLPKNANKAASQAGNATTANTSQAQAPERQGSNLAYSSPAAKNTAVSTRTTGSGGVTPASTTTGTGSANTQTPTANNTAANTATTGSNSTATGNGAQKTTQGSLPAPDNTKATPATETAEQGTANNMREAAAKTPVNKGELLPQAAQPKPEEVKTASATQLVKTVVAEERKAGTVAEKPYLEAKMRAEAEKEKKQPKLDFGVKLGYDMAFKTYKTNSITISPYLNTPLWDKLSLVLQPTIKYAMLNRTDLDPAQPYYRVTSARIDSAHITNSSTTPATITRRYIYTQKHDSISIATVIRQKSYVEFELPVILQYKLSRHWNVYGGLSLNYSNIVQVNEVREEVGNITRMDTLQFASTPVTQPAPSLPTVSSRFSYTSTPYSQYNNSTTVQNATNAPARFSYMLGVNYELKNRLTFDLLFQLQGLLTNPAYIPDSRVREIYRQPHLRFSVGYKLGKK